MPPTLFPALALVSGAVAGTSLDASFWLALPALPLLCVASAVAWWRHATSIAFALTLCGFACGGAAIATDSREHALHSTLRAALDARFGQFLIDGLGPEGDHEPLMIRAVLLEDAAIRDDYVSLRANVVGVARGGDWTRVGGGVTFTVSGVAAAAHADQWRAGRVFQAPATFRRPVRYLNDGVPDFERQLALDGTTLFGSVKSALVIEIIGRGSPFQEWAADVRARVRTAVRTWVAPHGEIAAAVVTAVLIGDRTGLPDEVTDRLQRAGTYHVIAISGGNIAVLAGLALGLLALIGVRGRARALITISVLVIYAEIATAGPSVWRATMMAVIYLAARLLDHRTPPWQATALAAGVMASVAPLDVRSAGFVLTFGATAALLESARWMRALSTRLKPDSTTDRKPSSTNRTWRAVKSGFSRIATPLTWLAVSIVASVAVEIALMPVSAASFSRVTLAGPLLNLVAVPLMAVAQVGGLAVAAFDAWPIVAGPAGWLAAVSASGIVESARFVDAAPALSWRVAPPALPLLVVYYGSLLGLLFASRLGLRLALVPVLALAMLLVTGASPHGQPPVVDGIRLTLFDVGQGEAMLLESGTSRLQIDAGGAPFGSGSFDIGARVVAPALWARRVSGVDAVLLTHGDPDHIGGAPMLLDIFGPRRLWEGVVVPRHEPSHRLRERAVSAGIGVDLRRAGESFQWGSARIRVLHPPEPDWERPRVRNDDSVVLEVTCRDVALLLTGDISADVERAIAAQLTPARTRILKVGHHGSRTSSSQALLGSWRPQIALISAGRGNTFGHPTPEVIERLESIGAQIYRTDRDGEITLESDCRSVVVRTFVDDKR
jgi:competence protein ComEC